MNAFRISLLAALLSLPACSVTQRTENGSSVPAVTRNIESGFFKVGGKLQKFFTGRDTLSEKQ